MGRRTPEKLPDGYVGRAEAAHILGITTRSLSSMVRRHLLVPHYFDKRAEQAFLRSDLQALTVAKGERNIDIRQVKDLALMALSSARRAEQRLAEVYAHLGLDLVPIQRDASSIRTLYEEAKKDFTRAQLRDHAWLQYWGGCFFSMDEIYLELVTQVTGDTEPWKVFIDFANKVTRAQMNDENEEPLRFFANKLFHAGRSHLRYVGYMHCRQQKGREVAGVVFDGTATAVDELYAILH